MAATKADVSNLALAFLKNSKRIVNFDTDLSEQAKICRQFYDEVRLRILGDWPWPFATSYRTLALSTVAPPAQWRFSYLYPAATVRVRHVQDEFRRDARDSAWPFGQAINTDGVRVIYTNRQDAIVEVTEDVDDVAIYGADALFVDCFRLLLASEIAPTLAGNDKKGLGVKALAAYEKAMPRAAAAAANEERTDQDPESEFIRCR